MLVKPVLLGAAGNLAYACHSAAGNYDAVCPGNPSAPGNNDACPGSPCAAGNNYSGSHVGNAQPTYLPPFFWLCCLARFCWLECYWSFGTAAM